MTEREAIARLKAIAQRGPALTYAEANACRMDADDVLMRFLRAHGCNEIVDAWEEVRDVCWHPFL